MIRLTLLLLAVAVMGACSASQVQSLTESGMILAGKDPEKARNVGSAAGQMAGGLADEMPLEDELLLGRGVALQLVAQKGGLFPDDSVQSYVNLVGQAVARQSEREEIRHYFGVLNTEEVNAWAAPGGYVFITLGTLRNLKTEAELAGVLAHEVSHVQNRHMIKVLKKSQLRTGFTGVLKATDSDYKDYASAVDGGTKVLLEGGLPHEMEHEADVVGVEIAAVTGYNPAALRQFLGNISKGEAQPATAKGMRSSTHPSPSSRVAKLDNVLAGALAGISGADQPDRYRREVLNKLPPPARSE